MITFTNFIIHAEYTSLATSSDQLGEILDLLNWEVFRSLCETLLSLLTHFTNPPEKYRIITPSHFKVQLERGVSYNAPGATLEGGMKAVPQSQFE